MWIKRFYEREGNFLKDKKVNLIYGPRRVGKTELIKLLLQSTDKKVFIGEGDDIQLRKILSSNDKNKILTVFQDYDIIFIDEAQRIKDIAWGLKILVDNLPQTKIIASGSSSFLLQTQIGEPLTGRNITNLLFPISILELKQEIGGMSIIQNLENYLIYGMYPDVLTQTNSKEKKSYLIELRNSYLLKDILELENIRNSDVMFNLLKLIAFRIGNEVSLSELGNSLGVAKQTVARYLDLLEKSFIIKKTGGFSRNLRKEIIKSNRYYFFDNGIRNALINNFNDIDNRNDIGMLWENFVIMERLKKQEYHKIFCNNYFWRTYDQKEVDFVEERDGRLFGYEFKWSNKKNKIQQEWLRTYENASFEIINKDNFLSFIS